MRHAYFWSATLVGWIMVAAAACGYAQVSKSEQIRILMAEAETALRANHPAAATEAYEAALRLDPENVEARANLGVVAMSSGDWKGAAENLHMALKLQPLQSKLQALLGLCVAHLAEGEEAQRLLSDAFPRLEEATIKREAGKTLLEIDFQRGEFEKASAVLGPLKELIPDDPGLSYAAFRIYSELAYQALNSLAIEGPDSALLHRALAEHLVNDGRTESAIAEYRKALGNTPNVADLHFELGEAIVAESHTEANLAEAQQEFESALRLSPTNGRYLCRLADVELLQTNAQKAALHFAQALKMDPQATCAKAGLAAQLMEEGKNQQALEYLEAAVHGDPYNAQLHYRLGRLYRQLGNKEAAEKESGAYKSLHDMDAALQRALHPSTEPNDGPATNP